jgi:hypothetical protein
MKTIKKLEDVLRAGNDGKNQRIKGDFVGKHVFCNVGSLVEFCIQNVDGDSPVQYDDIENLYSYPEYNGEYARFDGGSEEQRDEEVERLRDLQSDLFDQITPETEEEIEAKREAIENEISDLENLDSEPAEIFEWWAVSDFLYRKLKENGYCVVDAGSCYVWGRTTTGQAILLDYVITKICADMGILEGQENEW